MSSRKVAIAVSVLIGAMIVAGCGKVDLVAVDPTAGASGGSPGGPALNKTPVVLQPTPAPAPIYNPPLPLGKFEARVSKCDCGFLKLGIFSKTATVEVKNPTTVPLKGSITLQFTDDGTPIADVPSETRELELGPNDQQTITFAAKGMKIDGASVTVKMDGESAAPRVPAQPGTAQGGTAGSVYGTPPRFGY